jgi:hypothetical protein
MDTKQYQLSLFAWNAEWPRRKQPASGIAVPFLRHVPCLLGLVICSNAVPNVNPLHNLFID